jgi:hypothetical protein
MKHELPHTNPPHSKISFYRRQSQEILYFGYLEVVPENTENVEVDLVLIKARHKMHQLDVLFGCGA